MKFRTCPTCKQPMPAPAEPPRRIEIEGLRIESHLNAREHWAKKQKRVREERQWAKLAVRAAGWRELDEARYTVVIVRMGRREMNSDNVWGALKHVRDGIADGLGTNDEDPRINWICDQAPRVGWGVAIEISKEQRQ